MRLSKNAKLPKSACELWKSRSRLVSLRSRKKRLAGKRQSKRRKTKWPNWPHAEPSLKQQESVNDSCNFNSRTLGIHPRMTRVLSRSPPRKVHLPQVSSCLRLYHHKLRLQFLQSLSVEQTASLFQAQRPKSLGTHISRNFRSPRNQDRQHSLHPLCRTHSHSHHQQKTPLNCHRLILSTKWHNKRLRSHLHQALQVRNPEDDRKKTTGPLQAQTKTIRAMMRTNRQQVVPQNIWRRFSLAPWHHQGPCRRWTASQRLRSRIRQFRLLCLVALVLRLSRRHLHLCLRAVHHLRHLHLLHLHLVFQVDLHHLRLCLVLHQQALHLHLQYRNSKHVPVAVEVWQGCWVRFRQARA